MRKRIGILSAGWNDEYQRNLLRGITTASEQYDYDTVSFTSNNIDFSAEAQNKCSYNIFNLINDEYLDGVILALNTLFYEDIIHKILEKAEQLTIPVICVDFEHEKLMSIGTDNYASARILVEHLFEEDERRRPACITGVSFNPESQARVQAFKDVVAEKLGSYDEAYIYPGDFQYAAGPEAANYWHSSGKEYPDAVFCCNDNMAIGFLEKSMDLGYRVPEDVKVIGFDNTNWGKYLHTPLTSMQCPLDQFGKKAVEMIHAVHTGHTTKQNERLVGTPHFRKSSLIKSDATHTPPVSEDHAVSQSDVTTLFLANYMIELFAFCTSFDSFLERLQDIVHRFPCEEFYLCFTREQMLSLGNTIEAEEGERLGYMLEGYSSHMYMLVHYENQEFFPPQIYETKKILPIFDFPKEKRVDYVIIPLYFMGKTHGYCVLGNCNSVAYTGAFQTLTSLLSYSINSVYLQHELEQKAKTLEFLHERDSLTEVYNRAGFKKYSQQMLQSCIANGEQMMVLFADMDGMKAINDQYGHEEGDIAICTFSHLLSETCIHGEIVSRFGGDEMIVFGTGYTPDMAKDFVERFQKKLDQYNATNKLYDIKVSVGYELSTPDATTDIDESVNKADAKMYAEKTLRKKRNC